MLLILIHHFLDNPIGLNAQQRVQLPNNIFSLFYFHICHSRDLKQYLICARSKLKCQLHHEGHMQVFPDHLSSKNNHIPVDIDEFIINHVYERVAPVVIVNLVK